MAENEIDEQLKKIDLEHKQLLLEDLKYRVENERARRAQILRAHIQAQKSLDDANESIKAQQGICRHRKGGKNLEGIVNGHDSNYSVWKHTYPWGELEVICSRCGKEWRKPADELKKSDPKAYRAEMKLYLEAANFPTDNEPSGTQCFVITKTQPAA